jgi:transglutaminase-like putative cysteine protease
MREIVKRLAIVLIGVLLVSLSCSANSPAEAAPGDNFPLAVECTLHYTITVHWQGDYYPDTTIHVELRDIPVQTDHQQVEATLEDGHIENDGGHEIWVIDKYMRDVPHETIYFTGTFVITENIGNTPAVPHHPLVPATEMEEYLLPDNYVTLSPDVVSQAQQLVSETENDVPKIIAKFVDWIQKNITYSPEVGHETKLTDAEVLNARAGVCDEFSTLFMAFCRAVGIPARRVLGYGPISGDNIDDSIENTGHSWTEVWVPDYGWLTVDPTWADIGDVRRITGGRGYDESVLIWEYHGAPPGSGITDVTYSVTLTDWVTTESAASIRLTKEETENAWKITVRNTSPIPLLDNVLVEKAVLENWEWSEWSVVSNEIIFMNPQENYTFSLEREDGVAYFVWTAMAENSVSMWQYPGGTSTTPTPTLTPTPTPTPTTTSTTTPTPTPTPTSTPTPTPAPINTTWVWVVMVVAVAVVIIPIVIILRLRGK